MQAALVNESGIHFCKMLFILTCGQCGMTSSRSQIDDARWFFRLDVHHPLAVHGTSAHYS
jgi:hypothetical protein